MGLKITLQNNKFGYLLELILFNIIRFFKLDYLKTDLEIITKFMTNFLKKGEFPYLENLRTLPNRETKYIFVSSSCL